MPAKRVGEGLGKFGLSDLSLSLVHGMPLDWVASPMESRNVVYSRPTRRSPGLLAASGMWMWLGPKNSGEHKDQINHVHVAER